MFIRIGKWCGVTCLQLFAALICILFLGALPRLFKGLQIDLIGFWNTVVFLERSYFNQVKLRMDFGIQESYSHKYGFIM